MKGVWRWGEREIIYLSLHRHHQNDSCNKMGSDESHFNVSVGSDGQSHRTVSTNHNLFEVKGEPKRYRTEVLPLTKARIARDIPTLRNRAQLSHATNLPILTANRRVREGKGGREGSSLLPSPLFTVWNYKHYYLGEVLSRKRAQTGNTDQTITFLKNKQV